MNYKDTSRVIGQGSRFLATNKSNTREALEKVLRPFVALVTIIFALIAILDAITTFAQIFKSRK